MEFHRGWLVILPFGWLVTLPLFGVWLKLLLAMNAWSARSAIWTRPSNVSGSWMTMGWRTVSFNPYKYRWKAVLSSTLAAPNSHCRCLNMVVKAWTEVRCRRLNKRYLVAMSLLMSWNWLRSSSIKVSRSKRECTLWIPPCYYTYCLHQVRASPVKYDTKNFVAA